MPALWIIVQCSAFARLTEVWCEWSFILSRYVSAQRCTQLKVKTYGRLAMLSSSGVGGKRVAYLVQGRIVEEERG